MLSNGKLFPKTGGEGAEEFSEIRSNGVGLDRKNVSEVRSRSNQNSFKGYEKVFNFY